MGDDPQVRAVAGRMATLLREVRDCPDAVASDVAGSPAGLRLRVARADLDKGAHWSTRPRRSATGS